MILFFRSLLLALALTCAGQTFAGEASPAQTGENPAQAVLLMEETSVQPGHPFWVAIRLEMGDQWHAYWKNPGGVGFPTSIEWILPEGFEASAVHWPFPERFVQEMGVHYGYHGEVWLLTEITPSKTVKPGQNVAIQANVSWLVCSDANCLPGNAQLKTSIPVKDATPAQNSALADGFAKAKAQLPKKQEEVTAERKLEQIKLSLPMDADVSSAYFCPANASMIDEKTDLVLEKQEDSQQYVATLQACKTNVGGSSILKGTLVLQRTNGDHEAWDIELPVEGDPGEIALAETTESVDSSYPVAVTPSELGEGGFAFALAVLFAFVGGLLLNLMPCVLPVISLKIFSFVKMAGHSRRLIFKHGLLFSAGVILSFWFLAGLLLILQAYGQSVGWGFQLQDPLFVAVLATVVLLLSLNLFGVFEVGTAVASWAGQTESDSARSLHAYWGSFLSGVLATAVATPCTGPFLGSAVGYAVTLSPPLALLIFTVLGLGMAFPYLLLSAYPHLLKYLPKPGAWMLTFKELMGFFMLATALWLVWVFSSQTSQLGVFTLLLGFLSLSFGCWIYGKWGSPMRKRGVRWMGAMIAIVFFVLGGFAIVESASLQAAEPTTEVADDVAAGAVVANSKLSSRKWESFSAERLAELRRQNIPVIIDFTAKWCLICQTNHIVLSTKEVNDRMQQLGVVKMEADWTRNDPAITRELKKFGRNGVPLYVLYGRDPKQPPYILPQILTPDAVLEYLNKIGDAPKKQPG